MIKKERGCAARSDHHRVQDVPTSWQLGRRVALERRTMVAGCKFEEFKIWGFLHELVAWLTKSALKNA